MSFSELQCPSAVDAAEQSPEVQLMFKRESQDGPVEVFVDIKEFRVNDEVVAALAQHSLLYVHSGTLVQVVSDDAGGHGIRAADSALVREEITRCVRMVSRHTSKSIHPPRWCTSRIITRGVWPGVRILNGLVPCPVVRTDGTILNQSGFDKASGLFVAPGAESLDIPESPTQEDAQRAVAELLELVADFPFASDADRSVWLAACLTPFARWSFDGSTPLFAFDANCAGSGKTLLADLVGLIYLGQPMARTIHPSSDEEGRKLITSICMRGTPLILLDNVAGRLGFPSLDAAITSSRWQDRLLGTNTTFDGPMRTVWLATGNNIEFTGDILRRVFRCRLESKTEFPQDRTGFRHPDLLEHVRRNLSTYRQAALVVLSAYLKSDSRLTLTGSTGSIEGWSKVVRGAIVFAGQLDPVESTRRLRVDARCDDGSIRTIFHHWPMIDPEGKGVESRRIIEYARNSPPVADAIRGMCLLSGEQLPSAKALGCRLAKLRETVIGDRQLRRKESHGTSIWSIGPI